MSLTPLSDRERGWSAVPEPKPLARLRPRAPLTSLRLTVAATVAGLLIAGGTAALAGPYDSSGQRVAEARRAA
ncbi:D-alanyl-D-alanine carboxypeptidase/D-alanyl-D-alanine-endopeptidase, partial [Streptomyces sp. SID11385]|nr:D-alanyl-D-alanine carboxypeptidase/D-alanyl-D-alanine-endopeptidase [Streptomyces sp. SID11385]